MAGAGLEDAAALRSLGSSDPLACACAAVRCTEIDDIHLSSCTTPGSVIVPTALHLASKGNLNSWEKFAAAILAGYELLIRLGVAIDGPAVLGKQIWPTYFAAAFGSAAVGSRAFHLSAPQTAGALATALAFCSGTPSAAAGAGESSRWLSVGIAAANGVLAARSAGQGLLGSAQILERNGGRIAGVEISGERLVGELGNRFLFDDIGMKPYPVARQALAAIEAARELANAENIEPNSISEIVIGVPAAQLRVIDHPEMPGSRLGSIVSAQYQVALAILMPDRLLKVDRAPIQTGDRIRGLMAKVRVRHAPELDQHYPDAWPGRAEIKTGNQWHSRTVIYPLGDARNRLDGEAVAQKIRRLAAPHEKLIDLVRLGDPPSSWLSGLPLMPVNAAPDGKA